MQQIYENARHYIMQNGTELQKTALLFVVGDADSAELASVLRPYQNADGGWANGLEIEYQGNVSTPMTTAAALGYLAMFGLGDSDLLTNTVRYLEQTQQAGGFWDDGEAITKFPIPDYMGPGKFVEYKTGMMVKWLKRLGIRNEEMLNRAYRYLLARFPEVSQGRDFWTAAAYANAFSEYPPTDEHQRILNWAQQALTPPEAQPQAPAEHADLPWMMVQGLSHDDSHLLTPLKDQILSRIRANQLPTGGWSHPFGEYNAVWAAVLVVRYLKTHEQI